MLNAARILAGAVLAVALFAASAAASAAGTLETVKRRGVLYCGVSEGLFGFSERNEQGDWSGFDVDFCRAVAGANFDDRLKVAFVPLSASERFTALRAGEVDLLSRNSTWTLEREAGLGLVFAGITYHDGQGFIVMRDLNVSSALELDPATVYIENGMTSQLNLADFFPRELHGVRGTRVPKRLGGSRGLSVRPVQGPDARLAGALRRALEASPAK